MNRTSLLGLLPFVALIGGPFVFNRFEPTIFGFPFLLAWLIFSVVMTSVVMALVRKFDQSSCEN